MKKFAVAGLCAALFAAPLVVRAAELVVVDAAGQPIAVLVPIAQNPGVVDMTGPEMTGPGMGMPMQVGFPVANMFAQEDAMIRRMMSDFSSLPTMGQMPADAADGAGSTIMASSFSSGNGSCSRTVVYRGQPGGGAPLVNVSQTGNACGMLPGAHPRATVPVAEPELERAAPKAPSVPGGTKLYQIDYRHKLTAPILHRG